MMKPAAFACSALFLLSSCVFASSPSEMLKGLDSDRYADRLKAQDELMAWGAVHPEEALTLFYDEYLQASSPEAKTRLLHLLKERVIFKKFGKPAGFVGIRMDSGAEKIEGQLHAVVLVTTVVKGSPAEEFGLRSGDAIWRVDEQTFNRNAFSTLQFIEIVTSKREGDLVVIDLIRDGKLLTVKLVLGAMPAELERENNRRFKKDAELDKELYFENWLEQKLDQKGKPAKSGR